MPPTQTNGKICYVEIPTGDVEASAAFYRAWDAISRDRDAFVAWMGEHVVA